MAHAFAYCGASQNKIVVPDSVTIVPHRVCYSVKNIDTIQLGKNSELESTAFDGWTVLKNIIVSAEHDYYSSDESGILYSKGLKVLEGYPQARDNTYVTIPDATEKISGGVFGSNKYLVEFRVSKTHPIFTVHDGVLYTKTDPISLVM